jgi:hypothetical protein
MLAEPVCYVALRMTIEVQKATFSARATALVCLTLAIVMAGCGGSESDAPLSASTIPVSTNTHDGAGLAEWLPTNLRAAVHGTDALVVGRVLAVTPGFALEGIGDTPDEKPDPLPMVRIQVAVEREVLRNEWAAPVPSTADVFVIDPSQASAGETVGLEAGSRYLMFLRERDQVVEGIANSYGTAWDGSFTQLGEGDRIVKSDGRSVGVEIGEPGQSTVALLRAAQQAQLGKGSRLSDSTNPIIKGRRNARQAFKFTRQ